MKILMSLIAVVALVATGCQSESQTGIDSGSTFHNPPPNSATTVNGTTPTPTPASPSPNGAPVP